MTVRSAISRVVPVAPYAVLKFEMIKVIIVMGVAGSGKTTVGQSLAQRLQWNFADADDYHPPANVTKMSAGQPLTDEDRKPWLSALSSMIQNWIATGQSTVLACSALRSSYRDILQTDNNSVALIYLKADFELFNKRLSGRSGHFMKATMLTSQFQTLEEPEDVCTVDASKDPVEIVDEICRRLALK
ncbi:MAG: gluconokinase [Candidatus Obscuribacterales bacterium]